MDEKIEKYYRQKKVQYLLFSDNIEQDLEKQNKEGELFEPQFITDFVQESKRLLTTKEGDEEVKKNIKLLQSYLYRNIRTTSPQESGFVREPKLIQLASLDQLYQRMSKSDSEFFSFYQKEMVTRLHLENIKPWRACLESRPVRARQKLIEFLSENKRQLDVLPFLSQIRHSIHLDYVFLAFLLEDREVPQEEDLYMYFLDSINVFLKECPELFMNPEVKAKIMHWILLEAADKEFTLENGCKKGLETLLDEQEQKRIQDLQYQIKRGKDSFTRIS